MKSNPLGQEVLIEFARSGNAVKVTAIDPITFTEASIVGPADAGEETLRRHAVRKLIYVMNKKMAPSLTG